MSNYGGIFWNNDTRVYDISGANLQVREHIKFKNTNHTFDGKYNTLRNKPNLGLNHNYASGDIPATGQITFNASPASATTFSIHLTDIDGNNVANAIALYDRSTNVNVKGSIYIHDENDYKKGIIFSIKSLSSDNETYKTYNIGDILIKGTGPTVGEKQIITFTLSGDKGSTGAKGATGSTGNRGLIGVNGDSTDFSGLHTISGGSAPKTTDISVSGESSYSGSVKTYTVKGSIKAGQPVCLDMSLSGPITCKACDSNTSAETIIGIATKDTSDGSTVAVMTNGYVTARRTQLESSGDKVVLMIDGSFDQLYTLSSGQTITYKDPMGDNDYASSDRGSDIFDAGEGNTLKLTFNDFKFEGASSETRHYDRLSIKVSDNGSDFTDIAVPWMQKMLDGSFEDGYGTSFGGSSYYSTGSKNGNVLPINTTRAILLGSGAMPIELLLSNRYVKFRFYADSSTNEDGWDISIQKNPVGSRDKLSGVIGTRLYLDTNGYDKVKDSGTISLGFIAAINSTNDSIYMRSLDFSVYDGSVGPTGAPGSTGSTGLQGAKGDTGAPGSNGSQGSTGAKGTTGSTGAAGSNGSQGTTGAKGTTGNTGAGGSNGAKGTTGNTGAAGANGSQGTTGAAGSQGATGGSGLGFTSDNVRKIDLITVTQSVNLGDISTLFGTAATSTFAITQNEQTLGTLIKKQQTQQEEINSNTEKSAATGAQGAIGNTGGSGAQGATGSPGSAGARGSNGSQGTTGAKGTTGNTGAGGSNGAKGTTGNTGAAGANGSQGTTGSAGARGSTGYTGSTGAQGATGVVSLYNASFSGNTRISSSNPNFPLSVGGSTRSNYLYYFNGARGWTHWKYSAGTADICIYSEKGILTPHSYYHASDRRIKTNIREVDDNVALKLLRDIECDYYEYKDKVRKGTQTTIGFIAQQVKEHLPLAVSTITNIIPNEMRYIENPQWTTIDSAGKYKLTIPDLEDVSGNTKYKFIVGDDPSGNDECEKKIMCLENDPKSFIFEAKWSYIFLYGKEVDDFHILDKQKIFGLSFSATQEIDRIQQQEKTKLAAQDIEINTLKIKNQNLEVIVANLITQLKANKIIV